MRIEVSIQKDLLGDEYLEEEKKIIDVVLSADGKSILITDDAGIGRFYEIPIIVIKALLLDDSGK